MIALLPNFPIQSNALLSRHCKEKGLHNFHAVTDWVLRLPYRRNTSKKDLSLVFTELCGTCSTKHAALAQLALENNCKDLELRCGIYRMNEKNTPGVGKVLESFLLDFIPEAHVYLGFQGKRIDITRPVETETSPFEGLLSEILILPNQINEFKVNFHQSFLDIWRKENNIPFSLANCGK